MSSASTEDISGIPVLPEDSPGSSVSSRLQDEYDELIKHAIVIPNYNPQTLPQTLSDARGSFPQLEIPVSTKDEFFGQASDTESPRSTPDHMGDHSGNQQSPHQIQTDGWTAHRHPEGEDETPRFRVPVQTPTKAPRPVPMSDVSPSSETSSPATVHGDSTPVVGHGSPASLGESPIKLEHHNPAVDADIIKMEQYLDMWSGDLKRNVINELSRAKVKVMEQGRQELQRQRQRHVSELNNIHTELEATKELCHTYERSIERKDEVISNLTQGLQKQKERFEMMKKFSEWKIRHSESQREVFASNLARRHHERRTSQKCWDAWHSIVEAKWRHRVEKACQAKAQEVCMSLTNDYETRIASLNEALEAARLEVSRLHAERDAYEETMKKAFMRGVCALNMEAMTMFQEGEHPHDPDSEDPTCRNGGQPAPFRGGAAPHGSHYSSQQDIPVLIQQEPVYTQTPGHTAPPSGARVVTSQGAMRTSSTHTVTRPVSSGSSLPQTSTKGGKQPRVVTVSVSGRPDVIRKSSATLGGDAPLGLAPPMSAVTVERHQPVTKQTIGHATARRYPIKKQAGWSGSVQRLVVNRQVAGQGGHGNNYGGHTVKVVE